MLINKFEGDLRLNSADKTTLKKELDVLKDVLTLKVDKVYMS